MAYSEFDGIYKQMLKEKTEVKEPSELEAKVVLDTIFKSETEEIEEDEVCPHCDLTEGFNEDGTCVSCGKKSKSPLIESPVLDTKMRCSLKRSKELMGKMYPNSKVVDMDDELYFKIGKDLIGNFKKESHELFYKFKKSVNEDEETEELELDEARKKSYYAPTDSEKRITASEKAKFLKQYPDAKVTTTGGVCRVNGNYAYDMSSCISNDKGNNRFDKMVSAYNKVKENINESKSKYSTEEMRDIYYDMSKSHEEQAEECDKNDDQKGCDQHQNKADHYKDLAEKMDGRLPEATPSFWTRDGKKINEELGEKVVAPPKETVKKKVIESTLFSSEEKLHMLETLDEAKAPKEEKHYRIIRTKHRDGREYKSEGTLAELIQYYAYTLEKGESWQHEKGNKKINRNPKNIEALVKNLSNADNNTAANGYSGVSYHYEEM
jgi:hypothetical protein